jgi:diguanylate cyclase (GGDEF)-like protein
MNNQNLESRDHLRANAAMSDQEVLLQRSNIMSTPAFSSSSKELTRKVCAGYQHLSMTLTRYKRRAEWLSQLNTLHGRFAGLLDLTSMIETYSAWLMSLVEHDLLAYHNPDRQRTHLFCSIHGPARRQLLEETEVILAHLATGRVTDIRHRGFHLAIFEVNHHQERGILFILRQRSGFELWEWFLVCETMEVLKENLQRGLEYEELYEQARRDSLTGLANRRVLEERLETFLEIARRHGHPLTLASMDLDHFKQINDTFGHARGDEVLQQIGRVLAGNIRNSDLLVRMGGDEFMLVLPDTDREAARRLVKRLTAAVEKLDLASSGQKLGISIGLSQWRPQYSKEEWLQRADESLYQVKGNKRVRAAGGRARQDSVFLSAIGAPLLRKIGGR